MFAALAIFIALLELTGLASFITETRTQEIGIRQVLDAPVFFACAAIALIAAWLTIAIQAGNAARPRPVMSLRYE